MLYYRHTNGTKSFTDNKLSSNGFKLAGSVSNKPSIKSLLNNSDAYSYAESLIGIGNIADPSGAQLALLFPELGDPIEPSVRNKNIFYILHHIYTIRILYLLNIL